MFDIFFNALHGLMSFFTADSYSQAVEVYVSSKNPQTIADVEHYTQEFDRNLSRKVWVL